MRNAMLILSLALLLRIPQPVNPADYPEKMDYGTMTVAEQEAFDAILSAVAEGRGVVPCDGNVNHDRVRTHLGLYYGTVKGIGRLYAVVNGEMHLQLEAFPAFQRRRAEVEQRVEDALPCIREGSDLYKLRQISRYIADTCSYADDFVCADYAILFYKIASRLGIESYLCFGYGDKDLHVWNYAGGRFYDVTHFDSTGEWKYIGSKNAWGRCSAINNMWEVIKP